MQKNVHMRLFFLRFCIIILYKIAFGGGLANDLANKIISSRLISYLRVKDTRIVKMSFYPLMISVIYDSCLARKFV